MSHKACHKAYHKAYIVHPGQRREHEKPYLILSYYYLTPLENPEQEVQLHKEFLESRDVKARIYIATQGINGTLSAPIDQAYEYMNWMWQSGNFKGVSFKIHESDCHVFGRLAVKVRKELVAYGEHVSLENQGEHVSPKVFKELLECSDDKVVLDVRNDYEWQLGHFEGAEKPECATFRDFKEYARKLKEKIDTKKTKVLMYCTGGIRCEFFSSILKEDGFENVYQLDGGIINYGIEEKSKHWLGKLYVFDDRLQVPISEEESKIIGECHHCQKPAETYYNCASLTCNSLFLCCSECLPKYEGCCKQECLSSERRRPFKLAHTPFRRWHTYANTQNCEHIKD